MGDKGFEERGFRLPAEFLTKELMDKENMFKDKRNSVVNPRTPLPTELPNESYSYYSSNVNNSFLVPPFPVAPNVPEKSWAMASSNQSILRPALGNSSSLVRAPPIAPIGSGRNIDYNQVKNFNSQGQIRNFTPVSPSNPLPATMNGAVWGNQQAGRQFGNGGYDVMPGMAWGGPQVQNQGRSFGGVDMRPVGYGGALKRERAGTGVFLPRRYSNTAPESRKKTGGSTTQPPPRLAQAPNKKFENVTPQPRHFIGSGGHIPENEFVIARRNAAMVQELRKYQKMMMTNNANAAAAAASNAEGMRVDNEISLPQEWTY